MKNRLTKSQLEKLVREQLTEETRQKLDEGFLDSLKYAFAKVGSATAGTGVGKYINPKAAKKTAAAKEKLQKALDKEGAERVKKFIGELADDYENFKEFPNMKDPMEFQAILANFMGFYDSLKVAVDKYETGKGPEEQPEGALHSDIANEYVELLHKYLLNKQEVIDDVYKKVNESEEGETIEEVLAEVDWEKEAQKIADEEDDTAYDKEASTIKDLKSNKASIALGIAGLGSLAIGAKLIAMGATENTASTFLTDPGKITQVPGATEQYADSLVDSEGRGFLRTFRDAAASTGNPALKNIDFSENVDTLARVYGQDPKEIVLQGMQDLGREEFRGVSGEMAQQLYDFDKMGGNLNTVITKGPVPQDFIKFVTDNGGSQDLIGTLGTTTGSGAVPDAGVTILGMEPGGAVSSMAGKVLTAAFKKVIKTGAVTMIGKTALGGTVLAALGATLVPLGIGLIASAAAIKLARMKGLKSSRLATLQTVRDYIKKLKPKDPVVDPQPEEGEEEGPGAGVYEEGSFCEQMVTPLRDLNLKVGDIVEYTVVKTGVAKPAMVTAVEGMPVINSWRGGLDFTDVIVDYEKECARNGGAAILGPMLMSFNGEIGRRMEEQTIDEKGPTKKNVIVRNVSENPKRGEAVKLFNPKGKYVSKSFDYDDEGTLTGKMNPKDKNVKPGSKMPEGYEPKLTIKVVAQDDATFEAFVKSYTDQLVDEPGKEDKLKDWRENFVPELRKRRGMSAGKPEDDEAPELDSTAIGLADLLGVDTGIAEPKGQSAFKVKRPTKAGTMRKRKETRGGRGLEETTEINETLARWRKIAGIIKESKND